MFQNSKRSRALAFGGHGRCDAATQVQGSPVSLLGDPASSCLEGSQRPPFPCSNALATPPRRLHFQHTAHILCYPLCSSRSHLHQHIHPQALTMADASIDETPISPTRSQERRGSLEKHLQHRPDVQDLKNRHILLDTNHTQALGRLNNADTRTAPCRQRPSSSSANAPQTTSRRASSTAPSARSSSSATSCPSPPPRPRCRGIRRSSRRTCARIAWRRGCSTGRRPRTSSRRAFWRPTRTR
jgi:hypothetical protein